MGYHGLSWVIMPTLRAVRTLTGKEVTLRAVFQQGLDRPSFVGGIIDVRNLKSNTVIFVALRRDRCTTFQALVIIMIMIMIIGFDNG